MKFLEPIFTILLLFFLGIFSPCTISAQPAKNLALKNIEFKGLKKNKKDYLYRIINSRIGSLIDLTTIRNDVKYLNQLSGIALANFRIDTLDNKANLIFDIEEAKTLFPIVNFGGIRDNFWFQLGFTEANLFGRGNQLTAFYQNIDNRHNINLYYRSPFIMGSRWGASFNLRRFASVEPIYFNQGVVFYDYTNNSLGGSVFYQFKSNHFLELGGTYFTEEFIKNDRHSAETTPGPNNIQEPKFLIKAIHQINEIDYHYFYQNGFFNQVNFESVFNINHNDWFNLIFNDLKYFKRMGQRGNLALRLRLGISTNSENPFAPFVLDSYVNIRGSGNRIDRGTATVTFNAEYRHTFFEGQLLAGQLVGFSDVGTWRNPGGRLDDLIDPDNFRHFAGAGFRIIYKKAFNAALRLDYGIDIHDFNERGFVLGFGQYF